MNKATQQRLHGNPITESPHITTPTRPQIARFIDPVLKPLILGGSLECHDQLLHVSSIQLFSMMSMRYSNHFESVRIFQMFQCNADQSHPPLELVERLQSLKSLHSTDGSCLLFEAPKRLTDKIPATSYSYSYTSISSNFKLSNRGRLLSIRVEVVVKPKDGWSALGSFNWTSSTTELEQADILVWFERRHVKFSTRLLEDSIRKIATTDCRPPEPSILRRNCMGCFMVWNSPEGLQCSQSQKYAKHIKIHRQSWMIYTYPWTNW